MSQDVLHQFLTAATAGDAITGQALLMRGWLRDLGFASEIFAEHIHPHIEQEVRPLSAYRRARGETWAVYRHSIGSNVPPFLQAQGLRLLLVYHNITPPEFFERSDPMRAQLARLGQMQLREIRPFTGLALADSPFNELDLRAAGYEETAVLPITLQQARYDLAPDEAVAAQASRHAPNLLFVSRLAPNKRQEDLVKLLTFVRRIRPQAHLFLVGDRWEIGYDRWIEQLAAELGLADAVTLTGKVSQQAMVTYYKTADLYVSMSEHEGFGVPLIEAMYLGVPVLAYGVTAVPYTMQDAGIIFHEKDFERLAEVIDLLLSDAGLRARIVERQRDHARAFLEPQTRRQFESFLVRAGLCASA